MYKRKEIKKTGRERFPKIDLEVHYARRSPCGREKRIEKERERSLLNQVSMYTRGDRRVYVFFFFRPWNRNTPSSINKYFATTRCLPCLFFSHHYPLPLPRDSSGQESGWSIIVLGMWIRVQYSRPSYWLEQMDLLPQNAFRGCHEFHPILRHVVEEIHLPSLPNKPTDREYHAEIKLLLLITRLVTLLFCSIHAMTILFPWAMAYFSAFAMQACDVDFRPRRSLM